MVPKPHPHGNAKIRVRRVSYGKASDGNQLMKKTFSHRHNGYEDLRAFWLSANSHH
jgi:hypothetical protein